MLSIIEYFPKELAKLINQTITVSPKVFCTRYDANIFSVRDYVFASEFEAPRLVSDFHPITLVLKTDGTVWFNVDDKPFVLMTSHIRDIATSSKRNMLVILLVTMSGSLITIVVSTMNKFSILSSLELSNISQVSASTKKTQVTSVEGLLYDQLISPDGSSFTYMRKKKAYEVVSTATLGSRIYYLLPTGQLNSFHPLRNPLREESKMSDDCIKIEGARYMMGRLNVDDTLRFDHLKAIETKAEMFLRNVKDFACGDSNVAIITKKGEVKTLDQWMGDKWEVHPIANTIFISCCAKRIALITKDGNVYIKAEGEFIEVADINVYT